VKKIPMSGWSGLAVENARRIFGTADAGKSGDEMGPTTGKTPVGARLARGGVPSDGEGRFDSAGAV